MEASAGAYLRLFNGGRYTVDRIGRGSFASAELVRLLPRRGAAGTHPAHRAVTPPMMGCCSGSCMWCPPVSRQAWIRSRNHPTIRQNALCRALFPGPGGNATRARPSAPDAHSQPIVLAEGAHGQRARHRDALRPSRWPGCPTSSARLVPRPSPSGPGLFPRLCLTYHLIEIADARVAGLQAAALCPVITAATAQRVAELHEGVSSCRTCCAPKRSCSATDQTGHAQVGSQASSSPTGWKAYHNAGPRPILQGVQSTGGSPRDGRPSCKPLSQ